MLFGIVAPKISVICNRKINGRKTSIYHRKQDKKQYEKKKNKILAEKRFSNLV